MTQKLRQYKGRAYTFYKHNKLKAQQAQMKKERFEEN